MPLTFMSFLKMSLMKSDVETTVVDGLEFKPYTRYSSCGNDIQICVSEYKGVHITWRTVFWWNIFQDPSDTISIGLVLPLSTEVPNGRMEQIYEPEGFGSPHFSSLEPAIEFINSYSAN